MIIRFPLLVLLVVLSVRDMQNSRKYPLRLLFNQFLIVVRAYFILFLCLVRYGMEPIIIVVESAAGNGDIVRREMLGEVNISSALP
jgi:hypothetical protein